MSTLYLDVAGAGQSKRGQPFFTTPDQTTYQAGEDAFFLTKNSAGIADGISGWESYRGSGRPNPALYAFKLMDYSQKAIEKRESMEEGIAGEVMQESYDLTCEDVKATGMLGSATTLVAVLRDDELDVANLGDGGLIVRRRTYIRVFESTEQLLRYNTPYQLGTDECKKPSDAKKDVVKVRKGDIIILGSDGLFDNLWWYEIQETLSLFEETPDPSKIAQDLLKKARDIAEDKHEDTPFGDKARAAGHEWSGGKMDDISVVVAIVKSVPVEVKETIDLIDQVKSKGVNDSTAKVEATRVQNDLKANDEEKKPSDEKKRNEPEQSSEDSPSK